MFHFTLSDEVVATTMTAVIKTFINYGKNGC